MRDRSDCAERHQKEANRLSTVSIVIPNHNGIRLLTTLLSSLGVLNYPKFEVLLVDDASTDQSVNFVRKNYPWVKLVEVRPNVGPSEARNRGISASAAEYIAFLDNDTKVEENWLLELVKVAKTNDKIGACVSKSMFLHNVKVIDSAGGVCDRFGGARSRGVYERDIGQYDVIVEVLFGPTAAMLVKRRILDEIGAFDPDYFYNFEDVDLCWRIWLNGYRVVYVPSSLTYHAKSATMSKNVLEMFYLGERNRLVTLVKNFEGLTLLKILPIFFFIRLIYVCASIFKKRPCFCSALVKAIFWNITNIRQVMRKRARVQRMRKISDEDLFRRFFYKNSLDLNDAIMFLRGYRPSDIWSRFRYQG